MPDDDPESDVSDLTSTAAVAIPDFRRPIKVTEATNENIYMVPEDAGPSITDLEATVNLTGETLPVPPRDATLARSHLKGLLEALVFASDHPQKASDLAKAASSNAKEVKELLAELKSEYHARGIQLDEVAGGWLFRTSAVYAPFVRDLTKQRPVRLSRAQVETLAILAYRQPVTRPEIDEIRGVDSGPVLKVLLERDLVRIIGKKDEPGRPLIYGTTTAFLEFFGLKSLKDLPTLREFTELSEDSRRVAERELGDVLETKQPAPPVEDEGDQGLPHDTMPPSGQDQPVDSEDPPTRR
jgi:segregation and condensation protein B